MRAISFFLGLIVAVALIVLGCSAKEDSSPKDWSVFQEQSTGGADVLLDDDGRVKAVRGLFNTAGGGSAEERAAAFVDAFREPLGLATGVELGQASITGTQIQTVTFRLTAGGYRIEGGGLVVRLTPEAVFFVLISSSSSLPDLLEPTLDATAATVRATELVATSEVVGEPELVVHDPALLMSGTEPPRLAWRLTMQSAYQVGVGSPVLFVDAIDGSELGRIEQAQRAREREIYNTESCVFDSYLSACRELIYDESGVSPGASPWEEATTAWTFAADGCDFLQRSFAEERPCEPLVVYLNYEEPEYAAQHMGKLFFGEGALTDPNEGYRTFTHELGHALVWARTDNFTYSGESGAVQESIADVVSMLSSEPDLWVVDPGHQFERNLSDPAAAGNPKTYKERRTGYEDNGEVHINSVILSHAIWLATVEGLEVGHQSAAGMGVESMTSILDELLRGYLGGYVTLHQAAASLIDACMVHPMFRDVFGLPMAGVSFRDCGLLVNALAEVGLEDPDGDLDGWPDDADNCPARYNPYQEDSDDDDQGDACGPTEEQPDVACPTGLAINGLDWELLPQDYDENGVPHQPEFVVKVNGSGQTDLQCHYESTDVDVTHIRINYLFTKPDDPPSVPSCASLDTPSVVIDLQSETHSIGTTWVIINKTSIDKDSPEFAIYENAVSEFAREGMTLIEPFAARCN